MPFKIVTSEAGWPALNDVSTFPKLSTGTIARILDNSFTPPRGGEAIYLRTGGANVVAGSLVSFDPAVPGAVLAPATGGIGFVAVSFNVVPNGSYSWFQVLGVAAVKAPNAMVLGANVFMLAATPGSVDDAPVAGEQILGAQVGSSTGTPAVGLGEIIINRPFFQGQIT